MKAMFLEFNGRLSILIDADDPAEIVLVKLFLKQHADPEMGPIRMLSSGSCGSHDGREISARNIQIGHYSKAEIEEASKT